MPDDELELIQSADVEKLSREEQARALFNGTRTLCKLAMKQVWW